MNTGAADLPASPPPPFPRHQVAWTESLAAVVALAGAALVIAAVLTGNPRLALVVPFLAAGAWLCARYPAGSVVCLLVLTGAAGSLKAFTLANPRSLAEFLLAALWIGVIARLLAERSRRPSALPGLLLLGAFILLTAAAAFFAEPISIGWTTFQFSTWMMTALFAVAIAPWPQWVHQRIARGLLVLALAVGLYTLYRWFAGPAAAELELAREAKPAAPDEALRFYAGFDAAPHLASWCATTIPVALAAALIWRGRWRAVAVCVIALCMFGVIASEIRDPFVGVLAGSALTLILYLLSPTFPAGQRLARGMVAVFAAAVVGGGLYMVAIAGSEDSEARYERLLSPTRLAEDDPAFSDRLAIWGNVMESVEGLPFGHGLGSASRFRPDLATSVPTTTDSSYVKIAYEQGLTVMVVFVLALLILLFWLAFHSLRLTDPRQVALAIGACGTLLTIMVIFFAANYLESLHVLSAWLIVGLGIAQVTAAQPAPPLDMAERRAADHEAV